MRSHSNCTLSIQADHLVRKGRPLLQQESLDLEVPEERAPKRATLELLEAERLDDLETCMVQYNQGPEALGGGPGPAGLSHLAPHHGFHMFFP